MKRRVHLLCNAHLDPVWLWPWPEGAAEAISTFRTAADLCERNPGFIFNHNEVILYQWVQEYEPALFRRIQNLVRLGRWHIMGGWFLQPDCNMPSGESFVRQILYGREYFQKHFGVTPTTAINFDPFGHTRGLVQILAKSGYDSYLFGRPRNEQCPLPAENFNWVGHDGSQITATRFCGWYLSPRSKAAETIQQRMKENSDDPVLILWGVGNHGGGPSKKDLRDVNTLIRQSDATITHSTPEAYFKNLRRSKPLPSYHGSLTPWGVGCYTTQVRIKQKHRLLENELLMTEKMAAAAWSQKLMPWPDDELQSAGRDLMFSQFHDILPGSSIASVEQDALRLLNHGLETLSRVKTRAFFALSAGQKPARPGHIPIMVYNPHPYPIAKIIECEFNLPDQVPWERFTQVRVAQAGRDCPTQIEREASYIPLDWRKRIVFSATLEPGRMNRFDCRLIPDQKRPVPKLKTTRRHLVFKTRDLDVRINTRTGLIDRYRASGIDITAPSAFRPMVFHDTADPWYMLHRRFDKPAGAFTLLTRCRAGRFAGTPTGLPPVQVVEDGPVRTVVEALLGFGDSVICQRYKLPKHGAEIEIEIEAHWHEKDHMLKLSIPAAARFDRCLGQTAFGVNELPTTGDENVAQKWLAAIDFTRRLALTCINEGSYGSDCDGSALRLSLLRSPAYSFHPLGDVTAPKPDRYLPRIDQGLRTFRFWFNAGPIRPRLDAVDREALAHNEKPYALSFFPSGRGRAPRPAAILSDNAVQITALKKSRTGGDLIVRLFEPTGHQRRTTLSLPTLALKKSFSLNPYEAKTLRISPKSKRIRETNLLESPL
jgi:alpha-mannosidase